MGTRDRLIQAGMRLFAARGVDATTVGDLEKAAGLAPRAGGFYRHFRSKDDLIVEIVQGVLMETPDAVGVDDLLALGDTRAELVALGRAYGRHNAAHPKLRGIARQQMERIPRLHAAVRDGNARMMAALGRWIVTKPASRSADDAAVSHLVLMVFGSLLFTLSKDSQGLTTANLDLDGFVDRWASFWAPRLDDAAAPL